MLHARTAALVVAAIALSTACGSESKPEPEAAAPGDRIGSSQARVTASAPPADLAAAVASNGALALDLSTPSPCW